MNKWEAEALDRYHTLDGMRGVAALLVAAYHLQQRWRSVSISGYLAVDLFFVLSGFVIALNYTNRFENGLTVTKFLELRLIRLYPLYMLGLVLGIAKLATGYFLAIPIAASVGNSACAIAFGLIMLPDPCSPEMFPLNGPSWSLFFEIAINIAFAIILWRCSIKILIILMALSALSFLSIIGHPDFFNIGWAWSNISGGVARTIFSFCAGIVIYRNFPFSIRRTSYASLVPIVLSSLIIGYVINEHNRGFVETVYVIFIFPILVFTACTFEPPGKILKRSFGFIGDLSYPIYALHWPFITLMLIIAKKIHIPNYQSLIGFLIALIIIAFFAAKLDKFTRNYIAAVLKLRRTARQQAV